MIKILSAFVAFVFLLVVTATGRAEAIAWQTVKSEACGGFSVSMPGAPKEESASEKDVILHSYTVELREGLFTVACVVYLPGAKVDIPNELTSNQDNFNKESDATLIAESKITLQGISGLDFTSESVKQGINYRARIYADGNRVYMLSAGVKKGQDQLVTTERFLGSFRFTDR